MRWWFEWAAALTSRMDNHRHLAVLEAAEAVEDEINRLIDDRKRRLMHMHQLRKSAHAIGSNIREAFGRGPDGGRAQWLRVARGEADETIGHLGSNVVVKRIDKATFWRLRNRLITIIKMLNSLERL
jgi:four helix bundle protein